MKYLCGDGRYTAGRRPAPLPHTRQTLPVNHDTPSYSSLRVRPQICPENFFPQSFPITMLIDQFSLKNKIKQNCLSLSERTRWERVFPSGGMKKEKKSVGIWNSFIHSVDTENLLPALRCTGMWRCLNQGLLLREGVSELYKTQQVRDCIG